MLMLTEASLEYQLSINDWSWADQSRISRSRVLIKGVGYYLATDTLSKHRLEVLCVAAA